MADFSKEFQQKYIKSSDYDFSIIRIFFSLKEGEVYPEICEGYGFTAITRENGECVLIYQNGDRVKFENLDKYVKEKEILPRSFY